MFISIKHPLFKYFFLFISISIFIALVLLFFVKDTIGGGILLWWIGMPWNIFLELLVNKVTYSDVFSIQNQNLFALSGGILNMILFGLLGYYLGRNNSTSNN